MAKISARGDRELKRYKKDGATLVVTVRGRVLRKYDSTAGYSLVAITFSPESKTDVRVLGREADRVAGAMGYEAA